MYTRFSQDYTKITPRFTQHLPKISSISAQALPKTSPKSPRDRPKSSPRTLQYLPKISPRSHQYLPNISPISPQDLPNISPKSSWRLYVHHTRIAQVVWIMPIFRALSQSVGTICTTRKSDIRLGRPLWWILISLGRFHTTPWPQITCCRSQKFSKNVEKLFFSYKSGAVLIWSRLDNSMSSNWP